MHRFVRGDSHVHVFQQYKNEPMAESRGDVNQRWSSFHPSTAGRSFCHSDRDTQAVPSSVCRSHIRKRGTRQATRWVPSGVTAQDGGVNFARPIKTLVR
jgi:hypothetical protein